MKNQLELEKSIKTIKMADFTIAMKLNQKGGIEGTFHQNYGKRRSYELLNGIFIDKAHEMTLSFNVIWFKSPGFVTSTIFSIKISEEPNGKELIFIDWALTHEDISNKIIFVKVGKNNNSTEQSTPIHQPFPGVVTPFFRK